MPSDSAIPNQSVPTSPQSASTAATSCAVIINRDSGTVADLWDAEFEQKLLQAFEENGWEPELHLVSGPEIEPTLRTALANEVGAVITGGGDGTTTSVAGMLRHSDVPLGILPFGTLNLAARDLGSPLDPIEAVRALWPGRTREIDVLEVNGDACLCMTVIGMYPELLERSEEYHGKNWWLKFVNLSRQVYSTYRSSPILTVNFSTDKGENRSIRTRFILLTPGEYQDKWGLLPSRNALSTGRCHAYVSKHLSRRSLLLMTLRFLTGRSRGDPDLQIIEASQLSLSVKSKRRVKVAVDGELRELTLPVKFDLKPCRLNVLDPLVEDKDESKSV